MKLQEENHLSPVRLTILMMLDVELIKNNADLGAKISIELSLLRQ